MKAPDKIYIAETPNKLIEIWSDEPIESKPYITEHEYLRKDALLDWAKAEIELSKQVELVSEGPYEEGRQQVARLLINYLNSM